MSEIELLKKLVEIPSQIGIDNEKNISIFLSNLLEQKGFVVKKYEFAPNRPNIVATYDFNKKGSTIIFNGHMDTMPFYNGEGKNKWNFKPDKLTISNSKLYGRGTCDMKGGIAAGLSAIFKYIENNYGVGKIVVNLVSDEENTSLYGTIPLCEKKLIDGDFVIVLEPTECTVCPKQLGNMFFKTKIKGIGGHTGMPEGKINPFDIAYNYIDELKKWTLTKKNENELQPFINIGHFEGGTASGTIPTECEMFWGTRVLPQDSFKDYFDEILNVTETFKLNIPSTVELETTLVDSGGTDSFESKSIYIQHLIEISKQEENIFPASCDAAFFQNILNIPSVVFGPGSLKQAHVSNEYVSEEQLLKCSKIIYEFLLKVGEFCE